MVATPLYLLKYFHHPAAISVATPDIKFHTAAMVVDYSFNCQVL